MKYTGCCISAQGNVRVSSNNLLDSNEVVKIIAGVTEGKPAKTKRISESTHIYALSFLPRIF